MQSDTQSTALPTSQWFRRSLKWIGILAFLFLALRWRLGVGFSFLDEDEKQALKMVELFHERMNAGHFDEMYDDAHPAFREAVSRQEWLRHMKEARVAYGLYRARRSQTLYKIMGPPVQVQVVYGSTFKENDIREQFSFAREGDKFQLLMYWVWPNYSSRPFTSGFLVGVTSPLHSQPAQ